MAFQFPWTNFHELNLDWFLSKFKQFTNNYLATTATVELIPDTEQPEVTVTGGTLDDDTDIVDPFTFNFKLPVTQNVGAVDSVNGQTGTVVLDKSDIGLGNVDNVQQYSATNPPPYPVTSVNGGTGAVVLDKTDIGLGNVANVAQYSASNPPPYPVTSVNGMTGSVTVTAPVTSVNGQTGDVTISPATDAQVTTAVNTWLGNNVAQETGYVLDRSLTMSNAAAPADLVGDLKDIVDPYSSAYYYRTLFARKGLGLTPGVAVAVVDSTIRLAMPELQHASHNITININPGYRFGVATCDENDICLSDSGWKTAQYTIPAGTYYHISVSRTDNGTITLDEIVNIIISEEDFSLVDIYMSSFKSETYYRGLFVRKQLGINIGYPIVPYDSTTRLAITQLQYSIHDITININSGYRFGVITCNENDICLSDSGWKTAQYTIPAGTYYHISVSRTDNGTITLDEIVNIIISEEDFSPINQAIKNSEIELSKKPFVKPLAFVKGINHRGYNTVAPENTLPAFKLSKQYGFEYVESDVRFTSDNVPVMIHDATINRTSNGTGNVADMTYAQISQYDFGSWKSAEYAGTQIPTFEQFIALCKKIGIKAYVELKIGTQAQIENLMDVVTAYGMTNYITWISFDSNLLSYVKNKNSKVRIGYLNAYNTDINATDIATAQSLKTSDNEVFIDVKTEAITTTGINLAITADIPVEVYDGTSTTILAMNPYITGVTSDTDLAGHTLYINNIY